MIVSFVNLKGGVAKTTSAVNIGAVLAQRGHPTLLVDLDPQATLTGWFDLKDGPTAEDLLSGDADPDETIQATAYEDLDVIPSDRRLVNCYGDGGETLGERLRRQLRPAKSVYSYLLVDPPPSLGPLSIAAVIGADSILAPVQASVAAVDGLADTIQLARRFEKPPTDWLGAFVTLVDMRTLNDTGVRPYLEETFPGQTFETIIRQTVRVRESHNDRIPTVHHSPNCTASTDYQNLTDELLSYA